MAVKTWVCERDEQDATAPFSATLLIDDEPVAQARGASEMTAFAQLADVLAGKGLTDGRVLGFQALMRDWGDLTRHAR